MNTQPGATAVITHRIRPDKHLAYEQYVDEISPLVEAAPGFLDKHWVRPVPGLTETYTIIIRFDTPENLKQWMASSNRTRWVEKVRPLFVTGDDFFIRTGLDFWFIPEGAQAKVPKRWKQFLVSWSAIFPLVLILGLGIKRLFGMLGVPANPILTNLIVTGLVVFLMAYVIMPRYTRLVKRWLFS